MLVNNPYYVYINSRDRASGDDSKFTYNINFPDDKNDFTHVVCLNVLIPKSFYLIQAESQEREFILSENGVEVTITVPTGNYLLLAFKTTIASLLTTASPNGLTYTLTYPSLNGPDTGKWTYTQNNGLIQSIIICNAHLFEPLGFTRSSINAFTGTTLISTAVIKLQSEDRLLIKSNLVNNGRDDILVSINSITNVNFSSIAWECPSPEFWAHKLNSEKLNNISISLTDEDGEQINLNNLNLNLTLLFYRADPIYQNIRDFMKFVLQRIDEGKN